MKLTLLGTGIPTPNPKRRGASQVIEAGNDLILIDAGSGATHRLIEAGYERPALTAIALTHLHSDHVMGLPELLWTGWLSSWWQEPPQIWGPPGTAAMIEGLMRAFEYDIQVRTRESLKLDRLVPRVTELEEDWSSEGNGWRFGAFRVDHAPVDEAFGFRIDGDGGAIAVSGDTRFSQNLIDHAKDVDVLVHEVYWGAGMRARIDAAGPNAGRVRQTASYHTPADQVGKVAAEAGAKHVVLSHIVFAGGTSNDLIADIQPHYAGQITVGEDLDVFPV